MQGLKSSKDAAAYLAVSRTFFERHIAPTLPVVDLAPPGARQRLPRYAVTDLDAFIATRRNRRTA